MPTRPGAGPRKASRVRRFNGPLPAAHGPFPDGPRRPGCFWFGAGPGCSGLRASPYRRAGRPGPPSALRWAPGSSSDGAQPPPAAVGGRAWLQPVPDHCRCRTWRGDRSEPARQAESVREARDSWTRRGRVVLMYQPWAMERPPARALVEVVPASSRAWGWLLLQIRLQSPGGGLPGNRRCVSPWYHSTWNIMYHKLQP